MRLSPALPVLPPLHVLIALLASPAALHAQAPQADAGTVLARSAEVVQVLQGTRDPAAVFTPFFLASVPPEKLREIAGKLTAQHGKLTGFDEFAPGEKGSGRFLLRFERANATGLIQLDPNAPFKVAGFRIASAVPTDDSPQKILQDFDALPGRAGFALVRLDADGPAPVLSARPAQQFAIGSAFKLWVLDALAEDVASGKRQWSDVVQLGTRSLPGGDMRDWPQGAAVTLETLATLMIAHSDNTATDTLIRALGREAIDARIAATGHSAPERMAPVLTTLEAFALKAGAADAIAEYAAAADADQAVILAKLDERLDPAEIDGRVFAQGKPVAINEIEWFASTNDIAAVLDSLRRRADGRALEILAVAPGMGPASRERFAYAGYKGGSETGVLNLSYLVRSKAGEWFVIAASWNDLAQPVDRQRLTQLAERLLAQVQ